MPHPSLWSDEELEIILDFLVGKEHHWAGDVKRFPSSIWDTVASKLSNRPGGAQRTASACYEKWRQIKITYAVISSITKRFGWHEIFGADIRNNDEKWKDFLSDTIFSMKYWRSIAPQFRNSGWKFLEKVRSLIEISVDEPEEDVTQRPEPKSVADTIIVRRSEQRSRRHLLSNGTISRAVSKNILTKRQDETNADVSILTHPPGDKSSLQKTGSLSLGSQRIQEPSRRPPKRALPAHISPQVGPPPPNKRPRHSSPPPRAYNRHDIVRISELSAAPCPVNSDISERSSRMEAVKRVQILENDLSDRCIVALIDLFESRVETADTYLSLTRESVRKRWVAERVQHILEQGNDVGQAF